MQVRSVTWHDFFLITMISLSLRRVTLLLICAAQYCYSYGIVQQSSLRVSSLRGVRSEPASQPNNACPLPEWLSEFSAANSTGKPGVSLVTEAVGDGRLNATTGSLVVLNGGDDGDEGPLVLFDCSQRKTLVFLHIPKNAGTSIESIAKSHAMFWGANRIKSTHQLERQRMPDGEQCSAWHVPPYLFKGRMYKDSEVFCVVREPHDRVVSEYRWRARQGLLKGCSDDALNKWAQRQVRNLGHQRFHSDCHFVPQVDYVWNPKTHQQTCHHVLKMSTLSGDFNSLMANRGYQLRMVRHSNAGSACPGLSAAHLWPYTRNLINMAYKADYGLVANPPGPPKGIKPFKNLKAKLTAAKAPEPHAQAVPGSTVVQAPKLVPAKEPPAPPKQPSQKRRQVKLGASPDLCLNVFLRGPKAQSGDVLGVWTCSGAFNEELVLQKDNTVRLGAQPELCLSIFLRGTSALDGDQLGLYPCTGSWNQRFMTGADGTVRPLGQPQLCVSVVLKQPKIASGDTTGIYKCSAEGAWNQRFVASSQ